MHIGLKVGIAAATAGAVGFGAYKLNESANERVSREHAQIDEQVARATAEWDSWSTRFNAEFPGRRLDTPADHARLDQFLRDNPAPSWVKVEHEDYTSARLSISGSIIDRKLIPVEREKAIGYGGIGALGSLAMGGGFLWNGLRSTGGTWSTLGMVAGGAAMLGMGVGAAGLVIGEIMRGTNLEGYYALGTRVREEMK